MKEKDKRVVRKKLKAVLSSLKTYITNLPKDLEDLEESFFEEANDQIHNMQIEGLAEDQFQDLIECFYIHVEVKLDMDELKKVLDRDDEE